jgi:flavin reductase (DIM6/NTAB) family NADH-FMN oxidoreductase RutF/DNA-binding IclR family transcriptional regulator
VDSSVYRSVMGNYPTGVVFVSGMCSGEPVGMVIGSFGSVSLDPPLVSFMPSKTSSSYARLREAPVLCVNVLAHDQGDVCRELAASGPDKFEKVPFSVSPQGAPVIEGAVAHIHCTLASEVDGGDHWISVCEVVSMEVARPVIPLIFFQGGYGGFSPKIMSARGDAELIAALRLADVATPHVETLATQLECEVAALVAVTDDELTTAVTAYRGAEVEGRLGQRIPLIPPIGMAFMAFAEPPAVERWLAKAVDREQEMSFRRGLDRVLEHGVEIIMAGSDEHELERLGDVLDDYVAGRLTPARQRAATLDLAHLRHFGGEWRLDEELAINVSSVVAPVRNPEGDVSMAVRIRQLPPPSTGATVTSRIQTLKDTVATIEQELRHGVGRVRLQEYRRWFAGSTTTST